MNKIYISTHISSFITPIKILSYDNFTLYPKIKRPSIFTNEIARNQELASQTFTLEAKVERLLSYIAVLLDPSFDQSDKLSKEVWVG